MSIRTILHNSISLDGSYRNFDVNMGLHYEVVGRCHADIYLVGSNTAKTGIEMYHSVVPEEQPADFLNPDRSETLSYWVIPDTKGLLHGLLHVYRRFEFCRDIIVLVSGATQASYLDYLKDRNYDYIMTGDDYADYKEAFSVLEAKYHANTILADTGTTLGNVLLNKQLVDEISLLVHPVVCGCNPENLFSGVNIPVKLKLLNTEILKNDYLWILYSIENQ